jgi:hypothetical protein
MTSNDIQTATKFILIGELCKHALLEGNNALKKTMAQ